MALIWLRWWSVAFALLLFSATISSWRLTTEQTDGGGGISLTMQSWASERLDRLELDETTDNIVQAISIGKRQGIDWELRQSYSLSGAAHLLAVSGLHVGIVALLVNGLLMLLGLVRRGHIWRSVIAIVAIWTYAFLAGGSPSVIRAAIMFSGAQIAFTASQRYDGVNILLGTASVMLLINPNYIDSISFQLSFVAVAGIFIIYRPLYDFVKTRYKVVNVIWASVIIGIAASLAVSPLVSHYFGRVSILGVVLNPIVIATAHVIVFASLLWVLAPIGALNGLFHDILTWTTEFQNSVVAVTARQEWGVANFRLNEWQTIVVYIILGAIFLVIRKFLTKRK